jgi:hypothetical protein
VTCWALSCILIDHANVRLAGNFILDNCRLIWMCVPLCVVGVLLVAQPTGLFGGSSATSIGAAGLAVGITQVYANGLYNSCAWPCTCKSILSVRWHKHKFHKFVCGLMPVGM